MEVWVVLAVAAAAFQTLRFMLQKQLSRATLSTGGATFARFFYSAPIISTLAIGYLIFRGQGLPDLGERFWIFAAMGGLAQILATWCVVALFKHRNFAVGITFKKTEVLQAAIIGLVILGDRLSTMGLMAILLGFLGAIVLSLPPGAVGGGLLSKMMNKGAGLGLLSGMIFGVSAVSYRGATLEIASDDALMRAAVALAIVTVCQTIAMAAFLRLREPGELSRVVGAWKTAIWMGLTGMGGSLCWFTAYTLQNAAYVNAVGQIEVIFSLTASALFFNESISKRELAGIALITLSILLLVLLA